MCCTLLKATFVPCYALNLYQSLQDANRPDLVNRIQKLKSNISQAHLILAIGVIVQLLLHNPQLMISVSVMAGMSFFATTSIVLGAGSYLYFGKKLYDVLKQATNELSKRERI